jgi:hypothetical protein
MSKKVKLSVDLITAAQIRQVLFDSQKEYSYDFPTERITNIRTVIQELDSQIETQLGEELNT